MIHLFGLSLTQQFLILAGLLFQAGAYSLFSAEATRARLALAAQQEREDAKAAESAREEMEKETPPERPVLPKITRYRRDVQGVMEHTPEDVRPADLLRTARVHFKASLTAYQGETQGLPAVRREP